MRAIVSAVALCALAVGCTHATSDDVESSEQAAVTDVVSMTQRNDGQFDIVCRGKNGAANWTEIVSEAQVRQNQVCLGKAYVLAGNAEGTAAFKVDDDIVIGVNGSEVYRSTAGSATYKPISFSASKGATLKVELFDTFGGCLENADIWLSGPDIEPTRVIFATSQQCGTQANKSTPFQSITLKVGDRGPAVPNATDRSQSVLKNNGTQLAKDFTAALETVTWKRPYKNAGSYSFHFYELFTGGFDLGSTTHARFTGATNHFNVTPAKTVNKGSVERLIAWWQPKIDETRASVNSDYDNALITSDDKNYKLAVLNSLQAIIDGSMKPLVATFDRYPEVANIKLDL